jgi:hypothetical protein
MRRLVYDEPLASVPMADLRSVGVIVVDDLGEQVRGAVGTGQAPCPFFRVILPADRLAGGEAEHHPLEVDDVRLATLNLGLPASALCERGDALGSAGLAGWTPELNVHHLRLSVDLATLAPQHSMLGCVSPSIAGYPVDPRVRDVRGTETNWLFVFPSGSSVVGAYARSAPGSVLRLLPR